MRIEASFISDGAFTPGLITCSEFSLLRHIYFLLDTGSAISALSVKDVGGFIDYSGFEKKTEAAIGVGGSLECFLIHDIILYLFSTQQSWVKVKKFDSMCLLPFSTDRKTNKRIFLPSIIGRDIIGIDFDLIYTRKGIYLES